MPSDLNHRVARTVKLRVNQNRIVHLHDGVYFFRKSKKQKDPYSIRLEPKNRKNPETPSQPKLDNAPPQPQRDTTSEPQQRQLPKTINRPMRIDAHANVSSALTTFADYPIRESLFINNNFIPANSRTEFSPSAPAAIEVARLMYDELLTDNPSFYKEVLPEYLDYYTTAMLWARIVTLKKKLSMPLTEVEGSFYAAIKNETFVLPEPLLMQVKMFGRIKTLTGEDLYPSFPPLPSHRIGDFGGYYGPLDAATHNMYEEIPCLGVVAENLRHALSDADPGPYQSVLQTEQLVPNANLLGIRIIGERFDEAKALANNVGVTSIVFPEYPENTGLNIKLIVSISRELDKTTSFRLSHVNFDILAGNGSPAQAVIQRKAPGYQGEELEKFSCLRSESLFNEILSPYGMAMTYLPQMIKEASTVETASRWCCVATPPPEWVANRNVRRNIPLRYLDAVFISPPQNVNVYRELTVKNMVWTKR